MPAVETASIVREGRTYNGPWHVEHKAVIVSSAYGSKSAAPGKKKAGGKIAEGLPTELV